MLWVAASVATHIRRSPIWTRIVSLRLASDELLGHLPGLIIWHSGCSMSAPNHSLDCSGPFSRMRATSVIENRRLGRSQSRSGSLPSVQPPTCMQSAQECRQMKRVCKQHAQPQRLSNVRQPAGTGICPLLSSAIGTGSCVSDEGFGQTPERPPPTA